MENHVYHRGLLDATEPTGTPPPRLVQDKTRQATLGDKTKAEQTAKRGSPGVVSCVDQTRYSLVQDTCSNKKQVNKKLRVRFREK